MAIVSTDGALEFLPAFLQNVQTGCRHPCLGGPYGFLSNLLATGLTTEPTAVA